MGFAVDQTTSKTSYELHRYAGSRHGCHNFEVRDFLRHRDVQTTQQWYAYRLRNRQLRTIGMTDLLPKWKSISRAKARRRSEDNRLHSILFIKETATGIS